MDEPAFGLAGLRHLVVMAVAVLAGCADAHGSSVPLPELLPPYDETTRLSDLTEDEHLQLCEWRTAVAGAETLDCGGGRTLGRFDTEQCFEFNAYYFPPGCPALVDDWVQCQVIKIDACRRGVTFDENLPECEAVAPCDPRGG